LIDLPDLSDQTIGRPSRLHQDNLFILKGSKTFNHKRLAPFLLPTPNIKNNSSIVLFFLEANEEVQKEVQGPMFKNFLSL
jgi:hypothetical protein